MVHGLASMVNVDGTRFHCRTLAPEITHKIEILAKRRQQAPGFDKNWAKRPATMDYCPWTMDHHRGIECPFMAAVLEREIKLGFRDAEQARQAILATGATPLRGRRLQEDCLLDTHDDLLRRRRCVLRVRMECGKTLLTFKGPVQSSPMKLREEMETVVGDGLLLLHVLEELGFRVWFRYEKYREEFAREDVTIAIDETPVGTFVEIEGSERGIQDMAAALARKPDDYVTDSYRALYVKHCESRGLPLTNMLFEDP